MGSGVLQVLSKKRDFVKEIKKEIEMFRDIAAK